jgi:hypothetical protein
VEKLWKMDGLLAMRTESVQIKPPFQERGTFQKKNSRMFFEWRGRRSNSSGQVGVDVAILL